MLEPDQGLLQRERTYVSYKYAIYNENKTILANIENCWLAYYEQVKQATMKQNRALDL